MIKKSFIIILFLVLAMALSACKGKDVGENGEIIIEFMHSSVEQERLDVIDKLVAKFEEENPMIKIKQVPVEEDTYNTKVVTLASAGELPAVIEVGQDYAKVMDKDQLIDKDSVANILDQVGKENYYEGALNLVKTEDGKSFTGVPLSGWVQGIWYNKKMLAEKNFKEPKNWDDVLTIAKAFTDKSNKKYGIALPTIEGAFSEQAFSQFALSNNANVLDAKGNLTINTLEMKEALEFYKELSDYTMPGSNDTTEVKDAFMNGTAPMAVYSTYILPAVFEEGNANNIGFAIPTEKTKAVFGTVSALTVSSGLEEKQKEAAEKFVAYMSQPENMTSWVLMSPGGSQPVNKLVTDNPDFQENEVVKSFGELSSEIAASFEDIQVFGLVDGKNYVKMGDITNSGEIPQLINNITVGRKHIENELKGADKAIKAVLEDR
ncbi:ABC transporter substrate-binding protein [Priestia filamentosa]|uniref:Sugar ABC transporter substrate-binding protein n=1 Tax=Priestia filamentosa TaxID=1402861 RepID=A0A1X7EMB6_9BACI|nr:sugar ABC transporter substrate-binding protein [Priestia filamentosa]AKO93167.1 sugar ABC transporter substrate-binding protein [Priestia filamentosa]MDT3763303.1 sugar ABC transporter substrate-binding protein [Priestia filamentosa]OXS69806.1 sugar ABC transporter substrate-binding protein [Priestia filamentosa]WRU93767.1 sugar ABC transporter substrate-binding protein [Priestia filamentosa]SMF36424.1 carbohydrate ABC transporter substrate-binding protein, CUT1 family [Priestia filamentos